ncbi:hypothetical protein LDENG_00204250 [Lucifuga dentata]|nr:hypothetical protein LDENG_00204250 [Lucifuga dentata]
MVTTRRGARVSSPDKTDSDQSSAVQATPSTGRRTRRAAKPAETTTHDALLEGTSSQLDETQAGHPAPPPNQNMLRRCTRASRLHSPEQPCTPMGSIHEADISDVESCCSAVSDVVPPTLRTRGRRRAPCSINQEDDDISEVESCTSVVSTSKADQSSRRSTRRKKIPESCNPAHAEVGDGKTVVLVETASCSSAVSGTQKVTRSQRKSTQTRSSAKRQTKDPELSDADSCTSSVSGVEVSRSTARRSTRSKRQMQPIPVCLDEASESSQSSAPTGRRSRTARGKAEATAVVSESQSCDSEGFESGPSMTTRSRGKTQSKAPRAMESDSELTDPHSSVGSPCSTRGRGTPCRSRTGSGNSSRAAKTGSIAQERTVSFEVQDQEEEANEGVLAEANSQAGNITEPVSEEDSALNDSKLENTVLADSESTLLEEDKIIILEETDKEGSISIDLTPDDASPADNEVIEVGYGGSVTTSMTAADVEVCESPSKATSAPHSSVSDSPCCTKEETVSESAVTARDLQEELSAENKEGGASEMVPMQETHASSQPLELPSCLSVTETICEPAVISEISAETEEKDKAMEVIEADSLPSLEDKHLDEAAILETQPAGEEEMEVCTSKTDDQQVVDSSEMSGSLSEPNKVQAESIQVTSSQEKRVTLEPHSEKQLKDSVVVQNTGIISLLESSEDEDENEYAEEEEREGSGEEEEEDLGHMEEATVRLSMKPETAGTSVEGLFMIDTRPGQEADEQYYKESMEEVGAKGEEGEEEQDEEFVDEEEDDDDEEAQILFSSKNPQLKELSSRIDSGIRIKELGGLYINFDGSKSKSVSSSLKKQRETKIQDEVMKKSVVDPEFEKKDAVPPYRESKQALKMKRKVEKDKSTGDKWFNMKAPELTQELKTDLQVLKMRGSMDSKRFYKKNDRDGFPKYFQVGTVVDNPADFYHSRIPKKQRKRTMAEELLADAEFRHNNKKKYQQIVAEKAAQGAGKRNRMKKQFHKK